MNRRSFITKALAGLAVVPVLGKLAQSRPRSLWDEIQERRAASGYRISVTQAEREIAAAWHGRLEAFQQDLLVEAAKVYPRALTDAEIMQVYVSSASS